MPSARSFVGHQVDHVQGGLGQRGVDRPAIVAHPGDRLRVILQGRLPIARHGQQSPGHRLFRSGRPFRSLGAQHGREGAGLNAATRIDDRKAVDHVLGIRPAEREPSGLAGHRKAHRRIVRFAALHLDQSQGMRRQGAGDHLRPLRQSLELKQRRKLDALDLLGRPASEAADACRIEARSSRLEHQFELHLPARRRECESPGGPVVFDESFLPDEFVLDSDGVRTRLSGRDGPKACAGPRLKRIGGDPSGFNLLSRHIQFHAVFRGVPARHAFQLGLAGGGVEQEQDLAFADPGHALPGLADPDRRPADDQRATLEVAV